MRPRTAPSFSTVLALITVAFISPAASADLRYTMTISIDSPQMQNMPSGMMPTMSSTYYYAPEKERTDSSSKSTYMNLTSEVIDDCTSGNVYNVDPALNIYTVSDMNAAVPDPFGVSGAMSGISAMGRHKNEQPKTDYDGTVTMNFAVTDIGIETVNGVEAHHRKIVVTTTTTGNVPAQPGVMTMDIWSDNTRRPLGCAIKRAMGTNGGQQQGMAAPSITGVKYIFTGDMTALADTIKGVPVRLQFTISKTDNGSSRANAMMDDATITMDRTDLSTDPLDPNTFQPPAGATQVTDDQFETQKRDAMMKGMGMPSGGGFGGLGHIHIPGL